MGKDAHTIEVSIVCFIRTQIEVVSSDYIVLYSTHSWLCWFSTYLLVHVSLFVNEHLLRVCSLIIYLFQIDIDGNVAITAASNQSYLLSQSTLQQMLERHDGMLPVGVLPYNQPRYGSAQCSFLLVKLVILISPLCIFSVRQIPCVLVWASPFSASRF